jgi:hypothetical protein
MTKVHLVLPNLIVILCAPVPQASVSGRAQSMASSSLRESGKHLAKVANILAQAALIVLAPAHPGNALRYWLQVALLATGSLRVPPVPRSRNPVLHLFTAQANARQTPKALLRSYHAGQNVLALLHLGQKGAIAIHRVKDEALNILSQAVGQASFSLSMEAQPSNEVSPHLLLRSPNTSRPAMNRLVKNEYHTL